MTEGTEEDADKAYTERLNHFLGMLAEEDPSRRWKAIEGLARLRDSSAVDPLIGLLDDEDWRVRQKAAWALGQIGDPKALLPLRHAMMHESEGVKEMIMEALDRIKLANLRE